MARYGQVTNDAAPGVQELIPDLIAPEIVASAIEMETFVPLLRHIDLTGEGANTTMPNIGTAMTFTAYSADASAPDEQVFDTAGRTLTPAQRQLDVVVPLKVVNDSAIPIPEAVATEAAVVLADDRDTLAAGLYTERPASSPDHFIGTDGVELNFTSLRDAQNLLYVQKAPKPFAWVVHPTQWTELLKDDVMINAAVKGSPVLTEGLGANGFATKVLDVEIYVAEQIVESSGLHSMMFSKGRALGHAFKNLTSPLTGQTGQLMVETDWNSARRAWEINMTYESHYEGIKGTSATTNTWLVDLIS